jgi:hypothetical protein
VRSTRVFKVFWNDASARHPDTFTSSTPPVAREFTPAGLRSGPKTSESNVSDTPRQAGFRAASHPSGSELPRHKGMRSTRVFKVFRNDASARHSDTFTSSTPPCGES